ncbi:MAG: acyl-CoA dehydrogenase [Myxococcales bacterium]|nr:acyl-CoA dehydrogenase [Myxococcales bacterium]
MSQNVNFYKASLREFRFVLFEQFKLGELLSKAPYANWGKDEVTSVLDEAYAWCCKVLGPLNGAADKIGCKYENGKVTTPNGFTAAWKSLYEVGWRSIAVEEQFGGQAGPLTLSMAVEEMMCGANTSFNMYPALTTGAADTIAEFGTPDQQQRWAAKMHAGEYAGTMCLTEPQAGSDVGAATTTAIKQPDGSYKIKGNKIFISGGDQDLSGNIVHLVLARTPEAPAGTKGLSLFIVPKLRADGSSNDVICTGIEHKMGIKASSTASLSFGESDNCLGELVGTTEQKGMSQMFHMMNFARIGVGIQGLAVMSSAYLNALEYAKDRKQGSNMAHFKDANAPRAAIIEHPDVRRMLLDMKARVEGVRALAIKLTMHVDRKAAATDDAGRDYHQGQVDLLVPLVKAYGSDQAFQVCATAIQTYGGAGYLKDWPVEQYARDAKIFSIYEGTNHIQALDLVGRKLGQKGGANFQSFAKDVGAFIAANKGHATLGDGIAELAKALEAVTSSAMRFLGWSTGGKMEMVPLSANRFLEMMSELTVGWLLLDQAVIAEAAVASLAADAPDRAFYEGKRAAALYFAHNVLPTVAGKAALIAKEDRSPLTISDAAF